MNQKKAVGVSPLIVERNPNSFYVCAFRVYLEMIAQMPPMATRTPPRPPARKPSTAMTMAMASSLILVDATNATTPTMTPSSGPVLVAQAKDGPNEE